jgi:plastocyanin
VTGTSPIVLGILNGTAFYVLGSCLAVLALVVTAIGLRDTNAFSSSAVARIGVAAFVVLVIGTTTFAVRYSEDEQADRRAELAAEEAQEGATELPGGGEVPTPEAAGAEGAPPGQAPEGETIPPTAEQAPAAKKTPAGKQKAAAKAPGGTLALAADPTQIAYDKTALASRPGKVTIDFDNPSQISHDVAIAKGSQEIAKSALITQSKTTVTADLASGNYVFYCTVPGHREAGMQGTLTVK